MKDIYMSLQRARQEAECATRYHVDNAMEKYNIDIWSDYSGISAINREEDNLAHALMSYPKDSAEIKEAEEALKNIIEEYAESSVED